MKQEIKIVIEETEIQKALEKRVGALVKSDLRSLVDKIMQEHIGKVVTEDRVDSLVTSTISKVVHSNLRKSWGTTAEYEKEAKKIVTELVTSSVKHFMANALYEDTKKYVMDMIGYDIRDRVKKAIAEVIKEEATEEINQKVKEVIANKFKV